MQPVQCRNMVATLACLISGGMMTSCGDSAPPPAAQTVTAPLDAIIAAKAFDQTVHSPAHDALTGSATTAIATTVFIPAHREGETYPLILHSHGWGGNRINESDADTNNQNADTSTLYSRVVDLEVKRFWDAGYAVISFDERGIGQSGGQVRVMDPEFETVDAMAIIDWAEANLALARDTAGDPKIGTIGGSYGGGFQLLLAARDLRVDAITPSATWYDLNEALQDGGVLAKGWLAGLCLVAKIDGRRLDPVVQQACAEAADTPTTKFSEDMRISGPGITTYFREHSLAAFERRHHDPDSGYRMHPVHALFVQGMRDTLFHLNHAWQGYRFLNRLGGDVRLLTHQHGHILPAPYSQNAPLDGIHCGNVDTIEAIRAFMDAKLRGNTAALTGLPRICLSLDKADGIVLDTVPEGGKAIVNVPPISLDSTHSNIAGGRGPVFVPLTEPIAEEGLALAGIPVADLTVTTGVPDTVGVAFIAVGVQRGDGAAYPVDYQVKALRSDRPHQGIWLNGIGERLHPGDRVGVLLYGNFDEYEEAGRNFNFAANRVTVSGSVQLPIVQAAAQ